MFDPWEGRPTGNKRSETGFGENDDEKMCLYADKESPFTFRFELIWMFHSWISIDVDSKMVYA